MTAPESRFYHTADRIRAIYDQFPDGIDPDFDTGLEELEWQLAELRMTLTRN
jgi:hypothetical protein